jgi:hypothetical protein
VAFLANSSDDFISKSRLSDRTKKKEVKQEKFLKLVDGIIERTSWLTTDDIKKMLLYSMAQHLIHHHPLPPQCE